MFFKAVVNIVRFLVWIVNGKTEIQNKVHSKDTVFILAAHPQKSAGSSFYFFWCLPAYLFLNGRKQELFKEVITWVLTHMNAFPVNRRNPGPSALKQPVSILKEGKTNLLIFPTGSRTFHRNQRWNFIHNQIGQCTDPLPVVYQGTIFKDLILKRKKATVRFGKPIPAEGKADLQRRIGGLRRIARGVLSVSWIRKSIRTLCM